MIINDLVFTIGNFVFALALIPSLVSKDKPSRGTSASTATVLYAFTLNYLSLGLYFSSVVTFVSASLWLALYIQVRRREKIESNFST